jgi:hypothetical protein
MSLFRRDKPEEHDDEPMSAVLDVHTVEFAPKPAELVRAVEQTRPGVVPWSATPPREAGLYWWKPVDYFGDLPPLLCVVVDFGGVLSVRTRRGGTIEWRTVGALYRQWAGPVPLAAGMRLEHLDIGGSA